MWYLASLGEPCFGTNGPARLEWYHGLTENCCETTLVLCLAAWAKLLPEIGEFPPQFLPYSIPKWQCTCNSSGVGGTDCLPSGDPFAQMACPGKEWALLAFPNFPFFFICIKRGYISLCAPLSAPLKYYGLKLTI